MMNVDVSGALTDARPFDLFGGSGDGGLFSAISTTGTVGPRQNVPEAPRGIPSHTLNGVTWASAEAIAAEFGPDISATEDILAPVAALNLDNARSYTAHETTHFISANAFAERLRMSDRSRRFVFRIINTFLENAIGTENVTLNHRFGPRWCVDIYVPRARLAIDISSPQLLAEAGKVDYLLNQLGVRHIEFVCSPPVRASRFGGYPNALSDLGLERDESDVHKLLFEVLPTIFSHIFAQFSVGDIQRSATVNSYVSAGVKREFDEAVSDVLPAKRRVTTMLAERPNY